MSWVAQGEGRWQHPRLGEIRMIEPACKTSSSRFVWTDRRGRKSAPLPSLAEARLFALRHGALRWEA